MIVKSSIHLCKNSSFYCKSKHIDVRYHCIQDVLEEKLTHMEKVHANDNGFDMMTKCLSREKLEAYKQKKQVWLCPPHLRCRFPFATGLYGKNVFLVEAQFVVNLMV